jgi:hypothetical protein
MSEKPQKRLVSNQQYISIIGEKLSLHVFGGLLLAFGFAGLVLLWALWKSGFAVNPDTQDATEVFAVAVSAVSLLLLVSSRFLLRKASKIESVAPITTRAVHLLPPEEILVRGSDRPSTNQQAELLRAAGQGPETPAEELLRASGNRRLIETEIALNRQRSSNEEGC